MQTGSSSHPDPGAPGVGQASASLVERLRRKANAIRWFDDAAPGGGPTGDRTDAGRILLREAAAALDRQEAELSAFKGHLTFIAQQFCEGGGNRCSETEMCVTEYCLPCYAKAAIRQKEAPDAR